MPELPEVETVRLSLLSCLPGKQIRKVELGSGHTVRYPRSAKFCAELAGQIFVGIDRRGKYLLSRLSGGLCLVIHLGMSGRLLLRNQETASLTHVRMSITFKDGSILCLQDPRRFSRVWLVNSKAAITTVVPALEKIGVEPLSENLTEPYLHQKLLTRTQAVKAVLLDQAVIAGLGNIYADETLFKAHIHPLASARTLTGAQRQCLIDAIKSVLTSAIKSGGTTLRNYSDSAGVNGRYQQQAWVYGRSGEPCRDCGCLIRKVVVTARSTHFCPRCQHSKKSQLYQARGRLFKKPLTATQKAAVTQATITKENRCKTLAKAKARS